MVAVYRVRPINSHKLNRFDFLDHFLDFVFFVSATISGTI